MLIGSFLLRQLICEISLGSVSGKIRGLIINFRHSGDGYNHRPYGLKINYLWCAGFTNW